MDFIRRYLEIVNYFILGLVFAFTSFFLIINILHFLEVKKVYYVDFNDYTIAKSIDNNLDKIEENISYFSMDSYNGDYSVNTMNTVKYRLNECVKSIKNDTYLNVTSKNSINFSDVYNLTLEYENKVLTDCLNTHFNFVNNSEFYNSKLSTMAPLINLQINSLMSESYYLKLDLMSNSNYYYTTNASSRQAKNNPRDSFDQIMSSYNRTSSFILVISEWFKEEVTK